MKNKLTGFFFMFVVSLGAAFSTWFAMQSSFIPMFISSAISWLGYAKAHRQFTGKLVHEKEEEISIRGANTIKRRLGLVAGLILSIVAFPVCIVGVHYSSITLLSLGYLEFFSGYLISHYNWFGSYL